MKHQALFLKKDKVKKNKVLYAAIFVWCFKGKVWVVLYIFIVVQGILK